PGRRDDRAWYAAKALLINEQPQAALEVMEQGEQYQKLADLLFSLARYKEALAWSEKSAKAETGSVYPARYTHILLLSRAGETAKAREWLEALAKDMGQSQDINWPDRQIVLEANVGLTEQAEKHLLALVERNDRYLGAAFVALFPTLSPR